VDFVNPEAPWPALRELRERTAGTGQRLVERLPVHAEFLARPEFFDPKVRAAALRLANEQGYADARQEAA
jgi:FO synthase